MTYETLLGYFAEYGMISIFIINFMEYLNLPGLAAGVVMPLSGAIAAGAGKSFIYTVFVTTVAGTLASIILFAIGWFGGIGVEKFILKHFSKHMDKYEDCISKLQNKKLFGLFALRLVPAVRTFFSLPAGVLRINPAVYTVSTAIGVFIWNLVFVGAGYFFGPGVIGTVMHHFGH